ncbi:MAG: isopentenyl-diphosphate Delta-isomerase [Chitinophagales bacterium]|nr:isopentenyl-diphosphate Delta-isomerase [Chitinophagales bacterium]MDW8428279.1 isopentenyl-diphosphate Delta-isomerase [Chitinophagales bacterium]
MEQVILVNARGEAIGSMEKIEAHRKGLLHRAFSIFLFNRQGEMLLQRRAPSKYHFAGLWSNACCSHPRPGENTAEAAERRLREELGVEAELKEIAVIRYCFFDPSSGLTEHEMDHVFVGFCDAPLSPDPQQTDALRWVSARELSKEMQSNPSCFTPWFRFILENVSVQPAG